MSNLYTPTDTAKKALNSLGVSAYDTNGSARDFNTVVDELSNALSGLSAEEANAYKNSIFGIQGLDAFNKMANTSADSIEKFKTGLAEASGSTAEQAATLSETDCTMERTMPLKLLRNVGSISEMSFTRFSPIIFCISYGGVARRDRTDRSGIARNHKRHCFRTV